MNESAKKQRYVMWLQQQSVHAIDSHFNLSTASIDDDPFISNEKTALYPYTIHICVISHIYRQSNKNESQDVFSVTHTSFNWLYTVYSVTVKNVIMNDFMVIFWIYHEMVNKFSIYLYDKHVLSCSIEKLSEFGLEFSKKI